MDLTIEQLSKLTKLSIPTLRVYVSRQKLGKKVGSKRVFSQSDVQKLLKAAKKSPAGKAAPSSRKTAAAKKSTAARKPAKAVSRPAAARPVGGRKAPAEPAEKNARVSFWTRLFGGKKQKAKVSLMDAKSTK
jgi:hypothetical protein